MALVWDCITITVRGSALQPFTVAVGCGWLWVLRHPLQMTNDKPLGEEAGHWLMNPVLINITI
jgi:hypothetical protein